MGALMLTLLHTAAVEYIINIKSVCVCVSVTKFEYFFTNWASSVDTQMASSNCFDQIEEVLSLNSVKTDPGSLGLDKKQDSEKRD